MNGSQLFGIDINNFAVLYSFTSDGEAQFTAKLMDIFESKWFKQQIVNSQPFLGLLQVNSQITKMVKQSKARGTD